MSEVIPLLEKLQNLEITLNEAEILHGDRPEVDDLKKKCQDIRRQIDTDALARYDRLSRHGLSVVKIINDMCMGCHMIIPKGDLNRMTSGKEDAICPNCGRYLIL
ncbi:MAG: C4-type zinc ribbon domain-containing protein [Lentisphaeria bacterium]|nr:C4-type zinc ribbon domain-containing protein [Lentisphaeria bacterium]